jgi:hypothetical protein
MTGRCHTHPSLHPEMENASYDTAGNARLFHCGRHAHLFHIRAIAGESPITLRSACLEPADPPNLSRGGNRCSMC